MLPSSYIRNTCDFLIKEARRFFFLAMLFTLAQGVILFDFNKLRNKIGEFAKVN